METINIKHAIEIEILTPLAIGAGAENDWVKGVDFVVIGNTLYRLNLRKLAQVFTKEIAQITNFFGNRNHDGLRTMIESKLNEVSDLKMDYPAKSDNDIKTFIKNKHTKKPIIPGSSLKGALRSILFKKLKDNGQDKPLDVFGNFSKGEDLMRFIKIADIDFEKTELVNTKIFNLFNENGWKGGWKHVNNGGTNATFKEIGFNTIYEVLMPQEKGIGSIMFSPELFKITNQTYKRDSKLSYLNDITKLFTEINNHTKKYLEKEKAFFTKYSCSKTDIIISNINIILSQITNSDNKFCVLKMSAGSGFHSITGDWQFDNYDLVNQPSRKYKSRKIAINGGDFSLMGFVKIKTLSDEEISELNKLKADAKAKKEAEITEQIRLENEEKGRIEAEKKRIRVEKEKYEKLILEATVSYESKEYQNAKQLLIEADLIYPNNSEHSEILREVNEQLNMLQRQKEAEERNQAIQADANKKYALPLKDFISNQKKLSTLYSQVNRWLEKRYLEQVPVADFEALKTKIIAIYTLLKPRDQKELKNFNKWSDLNKLIGEAEAKKWFEEIVKK